VQIVRRLIWFLSAQQSAGKATARILLLVMSFCTLPAGVDSQRQVQRQLRLSLEERNLLRRPSRQGAKSSRFKPPAMAPSGRSR